MEQTQKQQNQKKQQDKADDLRLQLQHAERLATIGQLAAGLAHELNGPLGNILGYAQLAAKHPDLPERVYMDLDHIVRFALHAREIVKKVMLFSRQVTPVWEPVSLNKVVEDGIYLVTPLLKKRSVHIVRDLQDGIPEMDGDAGQLRQVVVNLLVNAVQAMPDAGTITISTAYSDDGLRLMVRDTGEGMDAVVLDKCFLPFFTTKDVNQGTGLGLSVAQGIVQAHGGDITVDSQPGKGTCFTVLLPDPGSEKKRKGRQPT